VHYAAEAATAIHWNRLSDHVGRKPVLLSCLAGTIVAILSFGLSRSFWALVFRYDNSSRAGPRVGGDVPLTCGLFLIASRCLQGALKGNIGVVKSAIAELTDETNVARGFSLLPMTWAFGLVVGFAIFAYSHLCSLIFLTT
jgi:MFS family permease